jgi:glycosyltransferase involved in cell wall biosynthesis
VKSPVVSIGVPVYNGERFVRFALDSIVQQDYTDFELIISDNASTDSTGEICRSYAAQDSRIRYLRADVNQGATRNFRKVVEEARGKYFKWAYHDDVCLPGFLTRCVGVLDQAPSSVVLVAPRTEIIDGNGDKSPQLTPERLDTRRHSPHQRLADVLRTVQWASAQCGLFRVEALRKTRLIDAFFASDYVLLAEMALLGQIWEIPEILFQRRFHPGVSTLANKTSADLLGWFDPSARRGKSILSPRMRLGVEYIRSIGRLRLPVADRFKCYAMVFAIWYSNEFRRSGGHYKSQLKQRLKTSLGLQTRLN